MSDRSPLQIARSGRLQAACWLLCLTLCSSGSGCGSSTPAPAPAASKVELDRFPTIATPDDEALLKKLCTQCHEFAEPNTLPQSEWESAVKRMTPLPGYGKTIAPKRFDSRTITQWFLQKAPESLPLVDRTDSAEQPPPLRRVELAAPKSQVTPFVSQIRWLTSPSGERKLLSCDMRNGWLCETANIQSDGELTIFCDLVPNPCRIELVDWNASGVTDLVVANLGSYVAMDHNLGTVDRLRRAESGWTRTVLAENLGRVADVKTFDFDADGDLDVAVAEFGWRTTGRVLLLENTTRKSKPDAELTFELRVLDERHGAVQVELTDLDGNGRQDVIALLAQEHERLVAYLNQPDGGFRPQELFKAPHPVWGFSGFQFLDFDRDNDLDVLLTNGDMLDGPALKPYHQIVWLENVGDLRFEPHVLAELPGVHRAEAADVDADGDLDIVACTLHPYGSKQYAAERQLPVPPALIWLEQTTPGQFDFHVWKHGPGRYPTLTTGDFDGDGRTDVAIGVGLWSKLGEEKQQTGYVDLWLSRHQALQTAPPNSATPLAK